MVKKSVLTRILFRTNNNNSKKHDQKNTSHLPKIATTTTENIPTSTSSSAISIYSNNNNDIQGIDRIFWLSPKQQHLISLLKCSSPASDATDQSCLPSMYLLRLYLVTIQKLKRHQPTTMEKQRAVYHILSNLVIQQELDRYEPAFEPIGRKPRKTRYISTLLDTPAESILPYHHPVLEASKRKPFVETFEMIIPAAAAVFSSSSSSSPLSPSCSTLSVATFPPYKRPPLPRAITSSFSDPSFFINSISSSTINDEEDNIPLAILKTRKK